MDRKDARIGKKVMVNDLPAAGRIIYIAADGLLNIALRDGQHVVACPEDVIALGEPHLIGTLVSISTPPDAYGNVRWAARYIDHDSGRSAEGEISGGESNITTCKQYFGGGEPDRILYHHQVISKREFRRLFPSGCYLACAPLAIVAELYRRMYPAGQEVKS